MPRANTTTPKSLPQNQIDPDTFRHALVLKNRLFEDRENRVQNKGRSINLKGLISLALIFFI
jgi:hypothetical protein